ncbi:unnamed protein product, partial [Heterosigma akashiwo]
EESAKRKKLQRRQEWEKAKKASQEANADGQDAKSSSGSSFEHPPEELEGADPAPEAEGTAIELEITKGTAEPLIL